MEQNDNTGQRLATLEEWSSGIERRVSALEKSSDILTQVQISLKELTVQNKYFGEKLDELKVALDKISTENQRQHDDLTNRISISIHAPRAGGDIYSPIKSQQFLGCLLYCFFATHQFGFKSFPL